MFSITKSLTLRCAVLLLHFLLVKLVLSRRQPASILPAGSMQLVAIHISVCKHLAVSSVSLCLYLVYAHNGCLHTGTQSNKGDRMENDSPTGNAATLPCYGITLFAGGAPLHLSALEARNLYLFCC